MMTLNIKSVDFENGKVLVSADGNVCKLTTTGFSGTEAKEAAIMVMTLFKNLPFKKVSIDYSKDSSAADDAEVDVLNDVLSKVRAKPTFQHEYNRYEFVISNRQVTNERGVVNTFMLELTTDDVDSLSNSELTRLLDVVKTRYKIEELYLVSIVPNDDDVSLTLTLAFYNNTHAYLELAGKVSSSDIVGDSWEDGYEGSDYVTFERSGRAKNFPWNVDVAAAVIKENFNIDNVVFIHPVLPIVVCKI